MLSLTIHLKKEEDGGVRITLGPGQGCPEHLAAAAAVQLLREAASKLAETFESGTRPLADPVALHDLGQQLKSTLLEPFWKQMEEQFCKHDGALLISTAEPELLNLPWELLPSATSAYLVADGRWSIRRTTRPHLQESTLDKVALPLRILFAACAPLDQVGLDYEREEEAMLQLATRLGTRVHLSIAEAGTFDELRNLITELKPHVVHLSGHGAVEEGIGYFNFEDERGQSDSRDARSMAEQLFAARGVRVVFVSGCQTSEAASGGVCQSLTAAGHVPVALGWGASIADGLATEFAGVFYHELASGRSVDASAATARRELYDKSQCVIGEDVFFDASFALPQVYAADATNEIIDEKRPSEKVDRPGVKYALLGDNIIGLKEGFVGRRRLLQRLRPGLRDGDFHVLLLTGMGGAGKSTLATRLANRCEEEGFHVVALKADRHEDASIFLIRLLEQVADACRALGRMGDFEFLLDGKHEVSGRLRAAVRILKDVKVLLVLDNLEDLMPLPPAAATWENEEVRGFFRELLSRLTGESRCILTCRYVPEGLDATRHGLAHEPLPDFSEAEFIKCLSRNERVVERMAGGEISRELLALLHKKIGGTPRFIKQAADVLATVDTGKLKAQLTDAPDLDENDALEELREEYLNGIFLPELYDALTPEHRSALSRLAVVEVPLPLDGVAQVSGLPEVEAKKAIGVFLTRGLVQKIGEEHEIPLYCVYTIQRRFLCDSARLSSEIAGEAHRGVAVFFRAAYQADREKDLRLHFMAELFACREHAEKAQEPELLEWASLAIARNLYGAAEFRAALTLLAPLDDERASPRVLQMLADCEESVSDWPQAKHHYRKALEGFMAAGDRAGEAAASHNLASIDVREGNYAAAREKFGHSLEIKQAIGDRAGEASTWHNLATIDLNEGNYAAAREKFGRVLEMRQAIEDRAGEAAAWHNLASIDLNEGNYATAREKFGRALEMRQAIGNRAGEASTWHNLASIDVNEGDYEAAREKFGCALEMLQAIGDRAGEASTWHSLASIDLNEGNYAAAREKFGRALEMLQAIGDRAGEASTWHQLATIDLNGGNYPAAREKFGRSLEIKQAIGNRAGEARTLGQISFVAWENGIREVGVKLQALAYVLLDAIGAAERSVAWENVTGMASALGLDQEGFTVMVNDVMERYQKDRGMGLVERAFEKL